MNPEQIYDLFAGISQANGSFVRIADALEAIDDKVCETNDKVEETNERLGNIEDSLVNIDGSLSKIAAALERIALICELKETRSLTLKVENCFDPSDGPLCSQEPEEPEGFADMA